MPSKIADIIFKYLLATVGMFLVAIGIALSIISNLGTSALSCPAYVANLYLPGISVGTFTVIINMIYLLIQIGILRKRFKVKHFLQIVASAMLGVFIDVCMQMFSWIDPQTFTDRLVLILISCVFSAMGVSIEVVSRAWMLSAEMTVMAISYVYHKKFNNVKIIMDCTLLLIAMAASFVLFGNPFGRGEFTTMFDVLSARTEGIVIGAGTLCSAVLVGLMMKVTDPLSDRLMDFVIRMYMSRLEKKA